MSADSGGFGGYSPPGNKPHIKRISPNCGIRPLGTTPLGGDNHETFIVNGKGGLGGSHTTIRLPGNRSVKLPWER